VRGANYLTTSYIRLPIALNDEKMPIHNPSRKNKRHSKEEVPPAFVEAKVGTQKWWLSDVSLTPEEIWSNGLAQGSCAKGAWPARHASD
jgi:hypothetical protein